ncbi:hypothetical protein SEPCBS119000_006547 [Sporothrix epigloea]|uniref:t-SNARE coiled-coil homology domain-containing protein n=1 Tax=Sporothrix epigloea TaxID=1892477 RepID=A0ABP0E3H5_9PEZI
MSPADPLPPYSAPIAFGPPFSSGSSSTYDQYVDLGRLLVRLEQNLLRADSDRWHRLVVDEFGRLQARFDVAAARKLLTRVEEGALSIKVLTRRQDVQAELNRRRALIEVLQERLDNLDEEARLTAALDKDGEEDSDEDWDGDGNGDEDFSHIFAPSQRSSVQLPVEETAPLTAALQSETPTSLEPDETTPSQSYEQPKTRRKRPRRVRVAATTQEASTPTATATATSRPRQRRTAATGETGPEDTAHSTSTDVKLSASPERASTSLFGTQGNETATLSTEEAVLDHHRREQEALSEDILRLAQALKEKSLTTSRMLEDDKDILDRVGEGMNITTDNLSAASRSMSVLTRMTEGKGWWGRMMLLGIVYGLMLLLLLLFLFLPKLRL